MDLSQSGSLSLHQTTRCPQAFQLVQDWTEWEEQIREIVDYI